jgi:hypothetical protein
MGPRDWFSVGTRLIGLFTFVRAFAYFVIWFTQVFAHSDLGPAPPQAKDDAIMGVFHLALALALLFGAEPITRIVFYGSGPANDSGAEDTSE